MLLCAEDWRLGFPSSTCSSWHIFSAVRGLSSCTAYPKDVVTQFRRRRSPFLWIVSHSPILCPTRLRPCRSELEIPTTLSQNWTCWFRMVCGYQYQRIKLSAVGFRTSILLNWETLKLSEHQGKSRRLITIVLNSADNISPCSRDTLVACKEFPSVDPANQIIYCFLNTLSVVVASNFAHCRYSRPAVSCFIVMDKFRLIRAYRIDVRVSKS